MKQNFPILDKMLTATLFLFAASSMFSISITQISAGIGGLLWLIRTQMTNTWKEQRWPLLVPILFFALASLVAVVNAYDSSYSYKSLKKLLEFLIFFWILNCARENNLRNSLFLVVIASATLSGLFGVYQYWKDFNVCAATMFTKTVVLGNFCHPDPTQTGMMSLSRMEGSLSTHMTFAGLLMLSGVIALAWIMFQKQTQRWVWVSIGIITFALLLSVTRQAWFGFLTALVFLIFFWRKKILLLLPIILLAIYLMSPFYAQKRFKDMFSGEDTTFGMRLALWKGGWEVFKDYPLTGCGFRCVDLVNSQYPDPTGYVAKYRGMHNNFIQLAVDTGILGVATWLGIWFCFLRFLYHKTGSLDKKDPERWVTFGSAAAVIAFLAGGLFESNLYDSEVVMLLYFIIALPFTGSQNTSKTTSKI